MQNIIAIIFLIAISCDMQILSMEFIKKTAESLRLSRANTNTAEFLNNLYEEVESLSKQNENFWDALGRNYHKPQELEVDVALLTKAIISSSELLSKLNKLKKRDCPIDKNQLKELQERMKLSVTIYQELKSFDWSYDPNDLRSVNKLGLIKSLFQALPSSPTKILKLEELTFLASRSREVAKNAPELKNSALRQFAISVIKSNTIYTTMKQQGILNEQDQIIDPMPNEDEPAWMDFY